MKTKMLLLIALASLAVAGCSTYRGGTDDTYTYSHGSLYGQKTGGPAVFRPNADDPSTLTKPPLASPPYQH